MKKVSIDPADVHVLLTKQYRTCGQAGRTAGWERESDRGLPLCNTGFPWLPQESSHPSRLEEKRRKQTAKVLWTILEAVLYQV